MDEPMIDWDWIVDPDHLERFGELAADHVMLAGLPVLFGLLISLPLGLACTRWPRLYPPVLAGTSILYALPSIALFAVLVPFTAGGDSTVVIPLTLYTLSVLVPNVVDGLRAVPESVRQSATAMGFSPVRRLVRVDLPIALPVVMAGARIAMVSSISLVTLGSVIGIGGLGELFTDGLGFYGGDPFLTPIAVGIVLTIAMAIAADGALLALQRGLTPWARARRRTGGRRLFVRRAAA